MEFKHYAEKKNILTADTSEMAAALLQDLGADTTDKGDRASGIHVFAKDEAAGTEMRVQLVENRAGMPESDWGYLLRVENDISPAGSTILHDDCMRLDPEVVVGMLLRIALRKLLGD